MDSSAIHPRIRIFRPLASGPDKQGHFELYACDTSVKTGWQGES